MPIQFRPEVTQHQQSRWNGQVLLLNGWPLWLTLLLTAGFIIALLTLLISGTYTRRITVNGEIITEPRTINLFAPEQGIVSKLLVADGQQVNAGTPLYQLDVSQVTDTGSVSGTTLTILEQQTKQLDAIISQLQSNKRETLSSLQQQLKQYQQAQQGLEGMVTTAREGLQAMRASRDSYEASLRKGLINTDQMNNQRYLYYQQQSVYQSLNSQALQQSLQITTLKSELQTKAADFDNQIAQSRYQRDDLARQRAETGARGSRMIIAPTRGVVSSLSVTPGQMVNAGDSLIQLVPSSHASVLFVAWLPDDSRPHVAPGETINIRYAAFPYEKYGQFPGRIVSVSAAPVPVRELEGWASVPRDPAGRVNGSWYKATVALDNGGLSWQGQPLVLSSGMQAQSTLFLEKRPLYQWMLSPYYSLKKSITGPVNE
ncbi:HlyD family efflux transporter periplasmic adaptor subunit [Erwinia sp. E602]|uniref:HlyD family secretion protein n=1 Tax=Erwinia sp. E602 TaxID=2675378 RepID=UPI001BA500A1|nr:HlyD family secretion protein [Erwinia sp. E602]QUG75640.1 HlyD family efflux transporter periplasmic adaptor subunit [Erwinia sp. E602]